MKLYHGSNVEVCQIDLSKSRIGKDFGLAFYLSDDFLQAQEMAQFKVSTFGGEVHVSEFELEEDFLKTSKVKFKSFDTYDLEWAEFILSNRRNACHTNIHDFDIVYGPIANDKVGRQIFNLEAGYIDMDTFLQKIKYPVGITFQWAFCTQSAIQQLKYIGQCK